jgi:hypothetical protein
VELTHTPDALANTIFGMAFRQDLPAVSLDDPAAVVLDDDTP